MHLEGAGEKARNTNAIRDTELFCDHCMRPLFYAFSSARLNKIVNCIWKDNRRAYRWIGCEFDRYGESI